MAVGQPDTGLRFLNESRYLKGTPSSLREFPVSLPLGGDIGAFNDRQPFWMVRQQRYLDFHRLIASARLDLNFSLKRSSSLQSGQRPGAFETRKPLIEWLIGILGWGEPGKKFGVFEQNRPIFRIDNCQTNADGLRPIPFFSLFRWLCVRKNFLSLLFSL